MEYSKNIEEVLKALDRAKDHIPKDWDYLAQDENVMIEVMEMEYNLKPLSDHLSVSKEIFPRLEELEDDEVKVIVEKIIDVWGEYNYVADLPDGLPIRIAYEALLSVWDETVMCCPFGNFHFDFYDMELEQYVNPSYKKYSDRELEEF